MATYVIGDIQGCYDELRRLLDKIEFNADYDQLWFCGDLVNRGPASLRTLQYVKSLGRSAITVLGNHDLHLLALYYGVRKLRASEDLTPILQSPDCDELMNWLRTCPLLHYDNALHAVMVHAGIHPQWSLNQAMTLATEVESCLQGDQPATLFEEMYGNTPARWSDDLAGNDRIRSIINIFTRMRYFERSGNLNFKANGSPQQHPDLTPWFRHELAVESSIRIMFGHWSALEVGRYGSCFALDGGCVWGGQLVALRIDHETESWHTAKPVAGTPSAKCASHHG